MNQLQPGGIGMGGLGMGTGNAQSIDMQAYFVYRFKEYLLQKKAVNRLELVLRMLVLYNWDSIVGVLQRYLRKYYYVYLDRRIEKVRRLLFCKTSCTLTRADYNYEMFRSYLCSLGVHGSDSYYHTNIDGVEYYMCTIGRKDDEIQIRSELEMDQIVEQVRKANRMIPKKEISVTEFGGSSGDKLSVCYMKPVGYEDVFLTARTEEMVREFVNEYHDMFDLYKKKRVVYKNNILLYGKPGTGKTSMIRLLASQLRRNICAVSLKNIKTKSRLLEIIRSNSSTCVIVLEELDCVFEKIRERTDPERKHAALDGAMTILAGAMKMGGNTEARPNPESELDLDDFLETLDGLYTSEDSVLIMTTNHVERIDDAFKRDGRLSYVIELTLCDTYQFTNICRSYYERDPTPSMLQSFTEGRYSTATVVQSMLRHYYRVSQGKISFESLIDRIEEAHQLQTKICSRSSSSDV